MKAAVGFGHSTDAATDIGRRRLNGRLWHRHRHLEGAAGQAADEYEMYDREADPNEAVNLAWSGHTRIHEQERAYKRLLTLLDEVERTRLQPLA